MSPNMQERIAAALGGIRNRRTGLDVVSSEMVRDIATTLDGKVRLTILLSAQDDAGLVRDVRQALERVEGVTNVRVDVRDPSEANRGRNATADPAAQAPAAAAKTRLLPVMDDRPAAAPRPSAPTPT